MDCCKVFTLSLARRETTATAGHTDKHDRDRQTDRQTREHWKHEVGEKHRENTRRLRGNWPCE